MPGAVRRPPPRRCPRRRRAIPRASGGAPRRCLAATRIGRGDAVPWASESSVCSASHHCGVRSKWVWLQRTRASSFDSSVDAMARPRKRRSRRGEAPRTPWTSSGARSIATPSESRQSRTRYSRLTSAKKPGCTSRGGRARRRASGAVVVVVEQPPAPRRGASRWRPRLLQRRRRPRRVAQPLDERQVDLLLLLQPADVLGPSAAAASPTSSACSTARSAWPSASRKSAGRAACSGSTPELTNSSCATPPPSPRWRWRRRAGGCGSCHVVARRGSTKKKRAFAASKSSSKPSGSVTVADGGSASPLSNWY